MAKKKVNKRRRVYKPYSYNTVDILIEEVTAKRHGQKAVKIYTLSPKGKTYRRLATVLDVAVGKVIQKKVTAFRRG